MNVIDALAKANTKNNNLRARIAELEVAILKYGKHDYNCAHIGTSRETAMFERREIPECDCWMSIAGQPEPNYQSTTN